MALACGGQPAANVPAGTSHSPETQEKATKHVAPRTERVTPMKIGGEVSAPKPLSRVNIRPPDDAAHCYQLGIALFEGVIDRTGSVREIKLIKGPDNEYTQAAREALAQQKFEPALYRGKPVDVTYHVSINHVPMKQVKGPCSTG